MSSSLGLKTILVARIEAKLAPRGEIFDLNRYGLVVAKLVKLAGIGLPPKGFDYAFFIRNFDWSVVKNKQLVELIFQVEAA